MAEAEAEESGEEGDVFREPPTPAPGQTAGCVPPAGSLIATPALWEEAEPPQPAPFSPAAPLAPEDLQRVLEQVRKAPPPPPPPRPPGAAGPGPRGSCGFGVVHDAARRLQDAAQQVAQHWGPDPPPPPPRLLQPKELEAIRVKVKSRERPMPPLAAIRPKTITLSQPFNGNTNLLGLSVVNPSIIQIQPLMRTEQQDLANTSSPPPLQLLVQRPLPPLGPVSVEKFMAHKMLNGQRATLVPVSASNTSTITSSAMSNSADLLISTPESECTGKLKKSLKVKTRSGRISRPPKYKAKDYKFIKTEDLADGHQSDSDDYSELNVEEEDDKRGKDTLFNSSNGYLKPKTFKCQTCEKSYIGQGGLARHYKLNPGHGQLEPKTLISDKPDGSREADSTGNIMAPEPSTPTALNSKSTVAPPIAEPDSAWNGQQNCDSEEVGRLLESEEKSGIYLARWGSRRTRGSKRSRKLRASVKSSCMGKHSNSVQPTSCTGEAAAEQNVVGNKARLKELLQQCDHEDLMELALPRLSKLVTVYEFLLMKVEKNHQAKPFFPDVYKEFEELHKMVKKMCQDYFSSSVLSSQQPLEIKNNEVAESLGITEELLHKKELEKNGILSQYIPSAVEVELGEITGQKRENEILEDVPVPLKRTRIESGSKNMNDNYASHSGLKEKTIPLCNQVNTEGINLQLNSTTSQSSEETYDVAVVDVGSQVLRAGQSPKAFADVEGKNEPEDSVILYQAVKGMQTCSRLENPGSLLPEQTELLPEYVHNHPPDQNTSEKFTISDFCCTMLSDKDSPWSGQEIQNRRKNEDSKSHQEVFNPVNEIHEVTSQPEKIFSTDMPIDNSCRTSSKSQHHPSLEASVSTEGILENLTENLDQFPESLQDGQREQESAVDVSETLAFEITDESQELSQGNEQIFIQTSDGLILSHPGTVVSEANDIVIVTDANGTAVHISTPDGLPLETLEALLVLERDSQNESIMNS
ncbi:zinc finger protein 839 [Dromiciops gliroides]|uniref:zinc finger protein 839 n=1 Tax=Dromiciops gliroides TaxID=33562 RepID=UPI001CC3D76E|nr:zinc finger protein 839 [Dromiciops gliroides]